MKYQNCLIVGTDEIKGTEFNGLIESVTAAKNWWLTNIYNNFKPGILVVRETTTKRVVAIFDPDHSAYLWVELFTSNSRTITFPIIKLNEAEISDSYISRRKEEIKQIIDKQDVTINRWFYTSKNYPAGVSLIKK